MSGAHGCTGNCTDPVAFEDELYYAELERQVLQLTADDNEGGEPKPFRRASYAPTSEASSVAVADFSVASRVASSWQIKRNGTGVFIPHAIKSRTRNSPAGMSNIDNLHRFRFNRKSIPIPIPIQWKSFRSSCIVTTF